MKNKLFPAPHFGREFRFGRELRLAASTVILLGAVAAAQAQSAPPPVDTGNASAPAAAAQDGGDPPTRVARLNYFEGPVTYEPAGATDWSYASLNRPLTTGDQVWVDDKGRSELHIGSTAVRMDALTSLDLVNLSDSIAQLKVLQGTMEVRIRAVDPGSSYEIDTPNLALQITTPGIYRVDVAADGSSTTVSVRDGSATAYGNGGSAQIEANQRINYTGTALQQADGGSTPGNDAFDQWIAARDATEDNAVSAHYVSREVPGYEDLDANGTWSHDPTYGEVWVPHAAVTAGWAPYHEGHWAWVAPWGWTWIDDAPWGFAPFHYGRWAYVHTNWAWVPGPIVVAEPPVYAPALVAFVGGGGGGGVSWGVNLSIGGAIGAGVAWIPLGPGEPWRPAYRSSPGYYNRMNYSPYNHTVNNFNNSTRITNITTVNNTFINRGAPGGISAVPANAFVQGRGVAQAGQTLRPEQIAHAQIGAGSPAIAPVKASFMPNQRIANNHPPQALENRQVVATRAPVTPAAFHDTLAAHYAQSGGRVAGAGEPVIRNAAPAAAGRPGTPIGANAGNRGAAGFQVVPAVRHPVEGAGQARPEPQALPLRATGRERRRRKEIAQRRRLKRIVRRQRKQIVRCRAMACRIRPEPPPTSRKIVRPLKRHTRRNSSYVRQRRANIRRLERKVNARHLKLKVNGRRPKLRLNDRLRAVTPSVARIWQGRRKMRHRAPRSSALQPPRSTTRRSKRSVPRKHSNNVRLSSNRGHSNLSGRPKSRARNNRAPSKLMQPRHSGRKARGTSVSANERASVTGRPGALPAGVVGLRVAGLIKADGREHPAARSSATASVL